MESDTAGGPSGTTLSPEESQALNSTILEYYKQFGRKRDLEQYFSLNTAQGEVKDVSSLFWRRMKSQDSSDSGEKSRDTSLEVCRIQIKCSAVDVGPGSSQDENSRTKSDSESPPIITEEAPKPVGTPQHDSDDEFDKSDEKSVKSDDNNSQKSIDAILDTSINKAYSPSSSIASQRKLEWDSLADVGYANESDKKTSASSLSTLERLALKQQYSNNDTHQDNIMGPPTAHSTPVDEADIKSKNRKGSKTTKIYRKDVERVEVNVPQGTDANPSQSINVNLTKHISFSVDQGGEISVENVKKDYSISPEKKSVEVKIMPQLTTDKEIQTSLMKTKDKSSSSGEIPRPSQLYSQGVPVLINLNNLKKRTRRKKVNLSRKKIQIRKKLHAEKENLPVLEKSGEQVSEAESFEYMPGHIYNQNQMNNEPSRSSQTAGNKSSLESSGAVTTDSSKGSKHSFTKDLENSIKLLRSALNKRYDDAELKQKLIKQVVQRLLKSNYRDDESTTDFLSGLSFSSKKLGLGGDNNTTTSTSDATNTTEKTKLARPKKSILRVDKFNSNAITSTSQSAPNLPTVSNSENPVSTNLKKVLTTSNSSSDASSKEKTSSDTAFAKTSSEELYQKYLDALRREEAYKKHLREKEQFLKQKLVASDVGVRSSSTLTGPASRLDIKNRIKLKELMKDLTRNNYDDGSGDASKLEGGHVHDVGLRYNEGRNQRSHSVFTLSSSGNSDQNRRPNSKKTEMKDTKAGHSKDEMHYCCCPHHYGNKTGVTDSSVQVNIRSDAENSPRTNNKVAAGQQCPSKAKQSQPLTHIVSDDHTGDIKYLCLSKPEVAEVQSPSENFLIYKCSRLSSKGVCCNVPELPTTSALKSRNLDFDDVKPSKGSQTSIKKAEPPAKETICIHEAIRVTQTDISINPRISDPSLTDIKITRNCDCVKLVKEQFRQVSKSSIDSEVNVNMEQNAAQVGDNEVHNQPCTSNVNRLTADAEIQSELDLQDREVQQPLGFYEDGGDYTIPIQGTNMTLKVSVGSNPITNMEILDSRGLRTMDTINSNENMYERESYNNAVGTTDNATLTEDLSKGVQSENKGLFSQYERKPRTVNTIFTNQEAYNKCPNKASVSRPQPFMRSNTFPGIEERNTDVRNEILDEFYEQEQWSTYPKTSAPKVLCACSNFNRCHCEGNANAMQMSFKNSQNDLTNPVVVDEYKPIERSGKSSASEGFMPVPEVKKRQKRPCGCPESAKCGGYCGKNASCRKQAPDLIESPGPMDVSKPSPYPRKVRCSCPESAKCGGFCGKNASCRKTSPHKTNSEAPKTSSPRKTSPRCEAPNKSSPRKTSPRYESPNKSSPRKTSPRCESPNKISPRKTPCDCPDSARCEGLCEDNVACRNKTSEVKECKPDEDAVSGNSLPENSDSDYPDFEKLKDYLRNQTFPHTKRRKAARSPSLPIDPKIIDTRPVITSTEYETPSDERVNEEQSAFGPSKIKTSNSNDLIMNVIKDITNRYSKKDLEKGQKKKCFKEILSILNYLLDTEDAVDTDAMKDLKNLVAESSSCESYDCTVVKPAVKPGTSTSLGTCTDDVKEDKESDCMTKPTEKLCEEKTTCDKGVQLSTKKSKPAKCCIESSDLPTSSEHPCTSSDSVTCKVLNKIRKECEKYHRKCCKRHQSPKRCQCSSTTSMSCDQCQRIVFCQCRAISANCDQCKRVHHCQCRPPNRCKCKGYRPKSVCERVKKKCVAYNLIIQTSESMVSEEFTRDSRPLKNIIVKVPPRKPSTCNVPFKEMEREIGPQCSPRSERRSHRSKSCPNDSLSSTDDGAKGTIYSVKDYLERNRPDFIEQSGQRQKCLKMISEASDQCRPCSSCKSSRQCSPTLKSIVIHGPSPTSTPRCAPPCTLFCRGVQMGCDPYKSDPCKPSDPCRPCDPCIPCKPCDPRSPCGPCSPCDPCSPCSSFDPCNSCVDSNQMQVTTIEPPKLISEREMKKHSERIYKKLPEVVQKKEDLKKENIKKTNLLMANIFKKNLQKKTLRGAVNLSNYSSVIKI